MKVSKGELKSIIESVVNETVDDEFSLMQEELELVLKNAFAEAWEQGFSKKEILRAVHNALSYITM